ncbi:hypothetical protein [Streptococcus suis]|uniref:hypothetical protein n=1 Tax=Streptococcus suis TaxID=1307 RepID=UPI0038B9C1E9
MEQVDLEQKKVDFINSNLQTIIKTQITEDKVSYEDFITRYFGAYLDRATLYRWLRGESKKPHSKFHDEIKKLPVFERLFEKYKQELYIQEIGKYLEYLGIFNDVWEVTRKLTAKKVINERMKRIYSSEVYYDWFKMDLEQKKKPAINSDN